MQPEIVDSLLTQQAMQLRKVWWGARSGPSPSGKGRSRVLTMSFVRWNALCCAKTIANRVRGGDLPRHESVRPARAGRFRRRRPGDICGHPSQRPSESGLGGACVVFDAQPFSLFLVTELNSVTHPSSELCSAAVDCRTNPPEYKSESLLLGSSLSRTRKRTVPATLSKPSFGDGIGGRWQDCACHPSHTTGRAVFRIRRLNPG